MSIWVKRELQGKNQLISENFVVLGTAFFKPPPGLGWYLPRSIDASGVYVYVAEIEFIDDEVILFKGDVTLVR